MEDFSKLFDYLWCAYLIAMTIFGFYKFWFPKKQQGRVFYTLCHADGTEHVKIVANSIEELEHLLRITQEDEVDKTSAL